MPKARHGSIAKMNQAQLDAFPDADYVIAVTLPRDAAGRPAAEGVPIVKVHAGRTLKVAKETNLSGMDAIPSAGLGKAVQLLPKKGQILKITQPDTSVVYCTNVPSWRWLSMDFTDLQS